MYLPFRYLPTTHCSMVTYGTYPTRLPVGTDLQSSGFESTSFPACKDMAFAGWPVRQMQGLLKSGISVLWKKVQYLPTN